MGLLSEQEQTGLREQSSKTNGEPQKNNCSEEKFQPVPKRSPEWKEFLRLQN